MLNAAVDDLSRQLREPRPETQYASLERRRRSCIAAMRVIEQVWLRFHHAGENSGNDPIRR